MRDNASGKTTAQARQAVLLWAILIVLAIIINQTLPFAMGCDVHAAHEMTNPEYWYGGMQFALVAVGAALAAAVSLWRKSLLPLWLGDGVARSMQGLLS